MPPRKNNDSLTLEDLNKNIEDKFTKLDLKLELALKKHEDIEERVLQSESNIKWIQQRERGNNVRVLGLELPATDKQNAFSTAEKVYGILVKPILELAHEDKAIPEVPSLIQVFDACHILPSKKDEVPALHIRFQSKLVRELMFQYKAAFFKSTKLSCSVFEDLCPSLRELLKKTKERQDVERVWSRGGRIKYKVKGSSEIHTAKI